MDEWTEHPSLGAKGSVRWPTSFSIHSGTSTDQSLCLYTTQTIPVGHVCQRKFTREPPRVDFTEFILIKMYQPSFPRLHLHTQRDQNKSTKQIHPLNRSVCWALRLFIYLIQSGVKADGPFLSLSAQQLWWSQWVFSIQLWRLPAEDRGDYSSDHWLTVH